jgi:transcriptional regulator with XRE-family HTH domain
VRPSLGKSSLAVLRAIAGLTQGELAELVRTSRPTIQAVELGKLPLSRRLAERISLHTGASMVWLLDNKYKVKPTCERDVLMPYNKEVFEWTRAEIEDPRTDTADLLVQFNTLGSIYRRLAAMLLQAYRANKLIYFQHKLRCFLDDLEAEFPRAQDLPMSDNPKKTATELWRRLKSSRRQKLRKNITRVRS